MSDRGGGQRIASCSGPAVYGSRITSYRAEGCGILSVVRFLHRIQENMSLDTHLTNFQIVCDNISKVRNVSRLLQPIHTLPHQTEHTPHYNLEPLQPEWDVLNEIWHTVKAWNGLRIHHVKGHQDSTAPAESLTLEAALNVEADALAGRYLRTHPVPNPKCPLFPHTHAHLHVDDTPSLIGTPCKSVMQNAMHP